MENWDPMKDEYNGNSGNSRKDHMLYVANIPMKMDKAGVQRLFEKYGNVLSCNVKIGTKAGHQYQYGIVKYSSFHGANSAISGLNNVPPLRLKITFFKPRCDESKMPDNADSVGFGSESLTTYDCSETSVQDATDHNPGPKDDGYPSHLKVDYSDVPHEGFKVHVDPDFVRTLLASIDQPSKQVSLSHRFSDTDDLSSDESSNTIPCTICSALTTEGCTRCWTPYCSVNCQKRDWSRHQKDCAQLAKRFESDMLVETSQMSKPCVPSAVTQNGRNICQPSTPNSARNEVVGTISNRIEANSSNDHKIVVGQQATPQPKIASRVYPIKESQKERASSSAPSASNSHNASPAEIAAWVKEAFPSDTRIKVQIAHVNSPCSFYIQQVDQTKMLEVMAEMQEVKQDGPTVFKDAGFRCGLVFAAQYCEDGETLWYRARVEKILPNSTAEILFVDFGNKETVECSSLRAVPKHIEGVHHMAVHCRLLGFPESDVYPEVILQKFRSICCGEIWLANVGQETGKLIVRLDNGNAAGSCINDVLRQDLEKILPLRMKSLLEFCMDSTVLSLTVVTTNNNNTFWAIGFSENMGDNTLFLLEGCKNEITDRNPRDWKVSDYVLALSREHTTWYRAQIVEILQSGFKVQFLDFGNVETVNEIVPLQGRCKDLPCLAILCSPCPENMKDSDIMKGIFKTNQGQAQLVLTRVPAITLNLYAINDPFAQRLLQNDVDVQPHVASTMKSSQVECSSAKPTGMVSRPTANIDGPLRSVSAVDVSKRPAADETMYYKELKELEYERFPKMSNIDVLSAESSRSIYVHALDEVTDLLNTLQDTLNTFINENHSTLQPLRELKLGNLVCAKFKLDDNWYRSVIESIVGEVITVRYVDFGNVESVSRDRIVALPRQFLSYPKMGIHIAIAGAPKDLAKFFVIKERLFDPKYYPLRMEIVDYRARPLLVNVFTNKGINVMEPEPCSPALSVGTVASPYVLHNPYIERDGHAATQAQKRTPSQCSSVSSKSVDASVQTISPICQSTSKSTNANSVVATPSATPSRESTGPTSEDGVKGPSATVDIASPKPTSTAQCPKPKTYTLETSKTHCLPVGEELNLTAIQVTSPEVLFFWQPEKQAAKLAALDNEIHMYCCNNLVHSPDFHPVFGDLCLAQFSVTKKWYRGAVMVYGMEESQVLFVDYGNMESVHNSHVVPMIDRFMELPLQAVHCRIDGCYTDREWSESVLGKLIEIEDTVLAKVVSFDEDNCVYSIQIPSLTMHLKDMNILPPDY